MRYIMTYLDCFQNVTYHPHCDRFAGAWWAGGDFQRGDSKRVTLSTYVGVNEGKCIETLATYAPQSSQLQRGLMAGCATERATHRKAN